MVEQFFNFVRTLLLIEMKYVSFAKHVSSGAVEY